jgi:hypothetical protein
LNAALGIFLTPSQIVRNPFTNVYLSSSISRLMKL